MSNSSKHFLLSVFILCIFLIFALILVLFRGNFLEGFGNTSSAPAIILPSPLPQTETSEVHSADGAMKLIMQTKNTQKGMVGYTFLVSSVSGTDKKILFVSTRTKGEFSVSPNAWSPDNKYVYILKKGDQMNALVFKASGDSFSNDEQYIELLPLFTKRETGYTITDVTGWDSSDLLHVVTRKDSSTKGPAFWFEVSSKIFLQLY